MNPNQKSILTSKIKALSSQLVAELIEDGFDHLESDFYTDLEKDLTKLFLSVSRWEAS